uniref:Rab3 GTPase-activating protein catalytic subunit n=1 Tax=Phallusia mammillata TaxID=59560 RepID=A0A6F9DPK8_9ASCI|nr:rab3 GTPase-activating protein catalytic subunit-like [Phallusia mammillata]
MSDENPSTSKDPPTEIQEEEVFEIIDFTNASDWEKFIAQIDEAIIDWHLNRYINLPPLQKNELTSGEWITKSTPLSFSNVPFTLTLHQLKQLENEHFEDSTNQDEEFQLPLYGKDAMDRTNDFPARAHCLSRWFGLRCFLLITPDTDPVMSKSKLNLLRSSAAIALNNTGCNIPMFVQIQEFWRRLYVGHATSPGIMTKYDMVHLKRCPVDHAHVHGLLYMLKAKLGLVAMPSLHYQVASRFTYMLKDWGSNGRWPAKIPDPEALASNFNTLLTGCLDDPVTELHLAATWPYRTGDMIIDNDVHSDYDPLKAPRWSIRLLYADDVTCLLAYYLFEFMKTADRRETLQDLLHYQEPKPEQDIGNVLDRLSDPNTKTVIPIVPKKLASGISKVVSNPQNFLRRGAYAISRISKGVERIRPDVLKDIIKFIFSDSEESSYATESRDGTLLHHKLKAAPVGSLTHRLAICAIVVNLCHGGVWALAQLWHAFVTELRQMLDSATNLSAIDISPPDLRTSLLHQKLQMLNCCIFRKSERETKAATAAAQEMEETILEQASNPDEVLDMSVELTKPDYIEDEGSIEGNKLSKPSEVQKPDGLFAVGAEAVEEDSGWPGFEDELEIDDEELEVETSDTEQHENKIEPSATQELTSQDTNEVQMEKNQVENVESSPDEDGGGKSTFDTDEDPGPRQKIASLQSESDDEFFECEEESDDIAVPEVAKTKSKPSKTDTQAEIAANKSKFLQQEAAGRLNQCGTLKLLYEDEPLYIPITQEHAPQTEDQLEEQAEVFSKLGDTLEGSQVRAKMQSTSLLSDMEAFKAANPGCVLEDFVRWYSPRDFEEGCLSPRMRIPGNLWVTTWSSARPVPAHRQKRIFDDTKEAEKVLHFLTNLKPAEITQMLLPMCVQETLLILRASSSNLLPCLPSLPPLCNQIETRASQLFQSWKMAGSVANQFVSWSPDEKSKVEDVLRQIAFAENLVERARSLQHKFSSLGEVKVVNAFVRNLLEHPEVELDGGANGKQGKIVRDFFKADQARQHAINNPQTNNMETNAEGSKPHLTTPVLPKPAGREFIIRTMAKHPSRISHEVPHRLYAVLAQSEFRLALSVSSDTTFF